MGYRALWTFVALLIVLFSKRKRKQQSEKGAASSNQSNGTRKPCPPSERYHHYSHPTEEQHRTAEEFSWRSSYRLNTFIALVAVLAAFFAAGSFCETKRQANIAQNALNSQDRAWIGAPKIVVNADTSGHYTFPLTFQNVGKTPTAELFIGADIVPYLMLDQTIEAQCRKGKDRLSALVNKAVRLSAIPNSDFEITQNEDINVTLTDLDAVDRDRLTIVGCVVYQALPGGTRSQTGFFAELHLRNNKPSISTVYATNPD